MKYDQSHYQPPSIIISGPYRSEAGKGYGYGWT